MDKEKALEVVLDAARNWHSELLTYIIPGVTTDGEREGYEAAAEELEAALNHF